MKIAVVSSQVMSLPIKGYGGLEALAHAQAKGLAAKGHDVTLIAPDGSTCDGCKLFHTGPPGRWDEWAAYRGYKYHIGDGPDKQEILVPPYWPILIPQDVILDNSWNKWSYTLKAEGVLKASILGVMHAPVNTMCNSPPPVEKPCIICISEDQAAHWRALHNADARVAYNGIDLDFYKPLDLPRSKRFLFLARFSTIKGPDLAIEACRAAGVGLDLIGDTTITGEPELYNRCCDMADGKQIKIIGPCSRGETVWYYSQAHAMLHPNQRFREPLGLAPVEAQACGAPVIAWDNGAMRETIKHGSTGFLVKSLAEMIDLIRTKAVDSLDRSKFREWVESKFDVKSMVDRYEILAEEALRTGGW